MDVINRFKNVLLYYNEVHQPFDPIQIIYELCWDSLNGVIAYRKLLGSDRKNGIKLAISFLSNLLKQKKPKISLRLFS